MELILNITSFLKANTLLVLCSQLRKEDESCLLAL